MTYLNQLLEGKYGKILKKHRDLAEIIYHEQPDLDSIPKILEYAQNKSKYKNWTLRDFHKALAFSTTLKS